MLTAAFNLAHLLGSRSVPALTALVDPAIQVEAPDLALEPARADIDATEIGTLSPAALDEIAAQATAEAAKHGIAPEELKISLVVIDHLDVIRGVRISIATPTITLADAEGDPRGPLVARCQACGEDELKTVSIEGVLEALSRFERLREEAEAAEAEAEPAASAGEAAPSPGPTPRPADVPPDRPLQPLGWAGVAALGLGASAVIVGVTFVGLGERSPADLDFSQDYVRRYPTPGYALLGVGGVLAISGAVMLGVERRRARTSTLALTPHLAPTTAGVLVLTRF